jgi:15-hydroxyprostaglandin dehydrogenase (NAD)
MDSMSKPVAIITGAASGIGLSLTHHLLSSGWRVAMADRNEEKGRALEKELGPNVMFMKVDISKYDQQAALFQSAFEWGEGRLDFLAANAGIDDRQSLYEGVPDIHGPPPELNTDCIQVDMIAVLQGVWLLSHYARRNKVPGGKVVITSSGAGIYPMETNPQYTMAKHGVSLLISACIAGK